MVIRISATKQYHKTLHCSEYVSSEKVFLPVLSSMASTVNEAIDQELCDYVFVKHSKIDAACKEPNRIPSKLVRVRE